MIPVLILITAVYALLMLYLLFGFNKIEDFSGENVRQKTNFSIIIPYRNEAENLSGLFASLQEIYYRPDKFEIIMINDASEDTSEEMCRKFKAENPELNIQLLNSVPKSGSPKKDAISSGINSATGEYILTTDADCLVPEKWLLEFDAFLQVSEAKLVAGPVQFTVPKSGKSNFLHRFQELDFFSLQAATIGGFGVQNPFMCNGANLCYEKASFLKLNAYKDNDHIASGDDIFLLEKFRKNKFATGFLKSTEAVVRTKAQADLSSYISQRIRWAAKTSSYKNNFGKFTGLLVLLMNAALVIAFFGMLTGFLSTGTFFLIFLVKFNVDFVLIYKAAEFYEREDILKSYIWCSITYPFFSSYVAISSLFKGYSWKGRSFKK